MDPDRPAFEYSIPEVLLERVASRLHWDMRKLDPQPSDKAWIDLSAFEREYYLACAEGALLEERAFYNGVPATT